MSYPHRVSFAIGNPDGYRHFPEIASYDISCDMLDPVDGISLTFPWSRDAYDLARPDNLVNVWIDEQRVFSGVIDDRERSVSRTGSTIAISARDKMGRLVDESAPLVRFAGLGIVDLGTKLVDGRLKVTTSNATNRRLISGAASKRVSTEPAIDRGKKVKRKVEPGETRWQVLQYFLEEGNLLAWASADGVWLVIGRPNYQQPAQWRFTIARPENWGDTDVIEYAVRDSLGERYSRIEVVGARPAEDDETTTRQRGVVRNGPNPDGTGKDFRIPKRLMIKDDGLSAAAVIQRAQREMGERDSTGHSVRLVVPGHGQAAAGATVPALYAFDTIADLEDQEIGSRAAWYITAVRYTGGRQEGPRTELRLVPIGTDLRSNGG